MRVWVRILFLIVILLVGVFIGIHMAETNIQQVQGREGAPRAIQITPQNGSVQISVLGQVVETKPPVPISKPKEEPKEQDPVQEETTNRISEIGNQLGAGVRQGARQMLGWMFDWLS